MEEPMDAAREPTRPFARLVRSFGGPGAFGVVIGLALLCAAFLAVQGLQPCDNAYITFRHVRNLIEHGRPAWNLSGAPVLGSTTPAFIFTLALFSLLPGIDQVDHAALLLNTGMQFLIVVFAYLVARDFLRKTFPAILLTILVAFNAVSIYIFSQGFESSMLAAVLLATLYFLRIGRVRLPVVLASVAPLIRPEGVLLTVIVSAYLLRARRCNARLLLCYLPIPLLWLAGATAYYGSPIPHAILAEKKFPMIHRPYADAEISLSGRLPKTLSGAADLFRARAGPVLLDGSFEPGDDSLGRQTRHWIMLLGLPLAIAGFFLRPDGRIVYLAYPPLFLALYGWIGHTMDWYFPSFILFANMLLFGGWVRALYVMSDRLSGGFALFVRRWKIAQIACLLVFVVFATANDYSINRGAYRHTNRAFCFPEHPHGELWEQFDNNRYHHYRAAAEHLNGLSKKNAVAMISEVGVFGYHYEGDVIDTVGLCSPEALAFYPPNRWEVFDVFGNYRVKANNFVPEEMVMTLRPEFLVNSRFYIANLLDEGSRFLGAYEQIYEGGIVWGERVAIYQRRGENR